MCSTLLSSLFLVCFSSLNDCFSLSLSSALSAVTRENQSIKNTPGFPDLAMQGLHIEESKMGKKQLRKEFIQSGKHQTRHNLKR